MGKKTVKRLAILFGVMALLGGGGYCLRAFQVNRMAHGIIAKAERAEAEGKYDQAEALYREHLAVVPGDTEVQLKYAEVLLKHARTSRRQDEALAIFEEVLARYPGNAEVRRRAADVAFDLGKARLDKASQHIAILLNSDPYNGHLKYLEGRCLEEKEEFDLAVKSYKSAIEYQSPEWIEAKQRQATLLRDRLGKKVDADRIIDEMVKQAPEDYRAYLGRGRYRAGTAGKAGPEDFGAALADRR
jgi:tetratricopeptide (TPR) repeat protein